MRISRVSNAICRIVARRLCECKPLATMAQHRHMDWEDICEKVAEGFEGVEDFNVEEFLLICKNGRLKKGQRQWTSA